MSNNATTSPTQTHHITSDHDLEVRRIYKNKTPFTAMPLIRTSRIKSAKPDLLDILGDLSKGARDLFLNIKKNMDFTTYLAVLPNTELTKGQINKRTLYIKELEQAGHGLARRVPTSGLKNTLDLELRFKPSTFILSPQYLFPNPDYKDEIVEVWNQC